MLHLNHCLFVAGGKISLGILAEHVTNGVKHGDHNKEQNDDGASPVAEDQGSFRLMRIGRHGMGWTQEGQQLCAQVGFHGLVGCYPCPDSRSDVNSPRKMKFCLGLQFGLLSIALGYRHQSAYFQLTNLHISTVPDPADSG